MAAYISRHVIARARELLRDLDLGGAISRALSEHNHRYGHPADNVRASLQIAEALGRDYPAMVESTQARALERARPQALPPPYVLAPAPEATEYVIIRTMQSQVATRLARSTSYGKSAIPRGRKATRATHCADARCGHAAGMHSQWTPGDMTEGICLWIDCPCLSYVPPGAVSPARRPAAASSVPPAPVPAPGPVLAAPGLPTPRVDHRTPAPRRRPTQVIRYSCD